MKKLFLILIAVFSLSLINPLEAGCSKCPKQGPPGPPGITFPVVDGQLFFHFGTTPNVTDTGFWQPLIIAPDQTVTLGPMINIAAAATTITVTLGPPILLGPYAIVLYNRSVTPNPFAPIALLSITNSFNSDETTYGVFSSIPAVPGANVVFYYNPFAAP